VEEKGPAHKKTFLVELKLGDVGTWEGTGESIKKSKHAAAIKGLENCGLCIPDKPTIKTVNLTPTVELNGLAMKLGRTTQYRDLPPKPLPSHTHGQFPAPTQRQMNPRFRGLSSMQPDFNQMGYGVQQRQYNQYNSFMYPRQPPRMMRVSLTVGDQEFIGEGRDKQQARHNAAKKASEILREELQVQMDSLAKSTSTEDDSQTDNTSNGNGPTPNDDQENTKSEVSLVYEIATHRKMLVDFADINNIGPAHMKKFCVRATVGQFVTEGEGLRKKDAKKDAAVKMLQELKNLPEIPEAELRRQKNGHFSRRNTPGGNRRKPKCELDPTLNPISILGQILQGRHESAPVYSLVEERGHLSKKEFVLQVTVGNHKASGLGPNKKTAKTNAAEAMLELLGFRPTKEEKLVQQGGQNGNKTPDGSSHQTGNLSRQLKPGLLPMVPELAKQFGRSLNPLVAPVIQLLNLLMIG
jgi:double-stranded RNA-binding protein Staufen